jgi:hypothetical protein
MEPHLARANQPNLIRRIAPVRGHVLRPGAPANMTRGSCSSQSQPVGGHWRLLLTGRRARKGRATGVRPGPATHSFAGKWRVHMTLTRPRPNGQTGEPDALHPSPWPVSRSRVEARKCRAEPSHRRQRRAQVFLRGRHAY